MSSFNKCSTINIYRYTPITDPGVVDREWHFDEQFGTVTGSTTAAGRALRLGHDFGLPTTTVSVNPEPDLNDTNDEPLNLDIQVVDTYITVPEGGAWIRYAGGSEGYWAIEVGYCCGPLQLVDELGYQDREDVQSIVGPVFLPEGQHVWRGWNIDTGGTNSSHGAQYSTDGVTFTGVPFAGLEFSQTKRLIECDPEHPECDPVPDGWSKCRPECSGQIVDPAPQVEGGGDPPPLSTLTPVPDNEEDASIRTGFAGSTGEYADAGHNHPIRRQVHPAWPGVTTTNLTLAGEIVLDRRSTEEWVEYEVRWDTQLVAGNNWPIITIPTLAGFQQPIIVVTGNYRPNTNTFQEDTQQGNTVVDDGAAPVGPYMGIEWSHWSSTRNLYGPFRRENDYRQLVSASIKYVRL